MIQVSCSSKNLSPGISHGIHWYLRPSAQQVWLVFSCPLVLPSENFNTTMPTNDANIVVCCWSHISLFKTCAYFHCMAVSKNRVPPNPLVSHHCSIFVSLEVPQFAGYTQNSQTHRFGDSGSPACAILDQLPPLLSAGQTLPQGTHQAISELVCKKHRGFPARNGGIKNGWCTMGNPTKIWMTGGSPISGNQHFWVIQQSEY